MIFFVLFYYFFFLVYVVSAQQSGLGSTVVDDKAQELCKGKKVKTVVNAHTFGDKTSFLLDRRIVSKDIR